MHQHAGLLNALLSGELHSITSQHLLKKTESKSRNDEHQPSDRSSAQVKPKPAVSGRKHMIKRHALVIQSWLCGGSLTRGMGVRLVCVRCGSHIIATTVEPNRDFRLCVHYKKQNKGQSIIPYGLEKGCSSSNQFIYSIFFFFLHEKSFQCEKPNHKAHRSMISLSFLHFFSEFSFLQQRDLKP